MLLLILIFVVVYFPRRTQALRTDPALASGPLGSVRAQGGLRSMADITCRWL